MVGTLTSSRTPITAWSWRFSPTGRNAMGGICKWKERNTSNTGYTTIAYTTNKMSIVQRAPWPATGPPWRCDPRGSHPRVGTLLVGSANAKERITSPAAWHPWRRGHAGSRPRIGMLWEVSTNGKERITWPATGQPWQRGPGDSRPRVGMIWEVSKMERIYFSISKSQGKAHYPPWTWISCM